MNPKTIFGKTVLVVVYLLTLVWGLLPFFISDSYTDGTPFLVWLFALAGYYIIGFTFWQKYKKVIWDWIDKY